MSRDMADRLAIALDMFANHEDKIKVFADAGTEVELPKHIFVLFSPVISRLLSSIPPCQNSCFILPDFSENSIASIVDILENGFTTCSTYPAKVIEVAKYLEIDIENLEKVDDSLSNEDILDTITSNDRIDKELSETSAVNILSDENLKEYSTGATPRIHIENTFSVLEEQTEVIEVSDVDVLSAEKRKEDWECVMPVLQIEKAFSLATTEVLDENVSDDVEMVDDDSLCHNDELRDELGDTSQSQPTYLQDHQDVKQAVSHGSEKESEQTCKICEEQLDSVEALLYHYCFHFEQELLLKAAIMSEGKTCLKCKRTFEELDSVFILHFGLFHGTIIEILKEKNIGNFELSGEDKPASVPKELVDEVPSNTMDPGYTVECVICHRKGTAFNILMCYCVHFSKEFTTLAFDQNFVDHKTCTICGVAFTRKLSAVRHVGTTHGKVNILLKKKGISEIINIDHSIEEESNVKSGQTIPRKRQENADRATPTYDRRMWRQADRVANAYQYLLSSRNENADTKQASKDIDTENIENKTETITIDDESVDPVLQSHPDTSSEDTIAMPHEPRDSPSPNPSIASSGSSSSSQSKMLEICFGDSLPLVQCEICQKDVKKYSKLLPHYHGHFASQVRRRYADMMFQEDGFKCKICGHDSSTLQSLVAHISLTHKKILEILSERGIVPKSKHQSK